MSLIRGVIILGMVVVVGQWFPASAEAHRTSYAWDHPPSGTFTFGLGTVYPQSKRVQHAVKGSVWADNSIDRHGARNGCPKPVIRHYLATLVNFRF